MQLVDQPPAARGGVRRGGGPRPERRGARKKQKIEPLLRQEPQRGPVVRRGGQDVRRGGVLRERAVPAEARGGLRGGVSRLKTRRGVHRVLLKSHVLREGNRGVARRDRIFAGAAGEAVLSVRQRVHAGGGHHGGWRDPG